MKRQKDRQAGQVLVQVALMMVVLLGFLALAVDVSQVYLKRRQLQNAADAGALEGARQICFENLSAAAAEGPAEAAALLNAPGSIAAATGSGWQMTVVVTQTIPSFVASVVGQDVFNPGARAKAVCGAADSNVGGLWPLGVNDGDFREIDCGEVFTVFMARNDNQEIDCANTCDCETLVPSNNPNDQYPNDEFIATLLADGAPARFDSGQLGWLRLSDALSPLPQLCSNSCGVNGRDCWLLNTHPGPVSCGNQIPGQGGVGWSNSGLAAIEHHVDNATVLNVPLWVRPADLSCDLLGPLPNSCNINANELMYTINSFGCIRILGYGTFTIPPRPPSNNCQFGSSVKVIFAERICPCNSYQGGTGGTAPGDGVRAVSLVE